MFRMLLAAALLAGGLSVPPARAAIVAVSGGETFAINEITGQSRRIGSFGGNAASVDGAGFLVTHSFDYTLVQTTLLTVDQATDTLLSTLHLGRNLGIRGLAIAPSGAIFAVDNGGGAGGTSEDDILVGIDPATGAVTTIGTMPISSAQSLEFDAAGRLLVSSFFDLYEVDTTSAALTPLLSYGGGLDVQTLFSLPDGRLLGGRDTFWELDPAAGSVSPLFTVRGLDIRGAFFDPAIPAPVPLPGAALALVTGLGALGLWRRTGPI